MGKYALIIVGALIFSVLTYSYALKNALFQSNVRSVQSFSQNQAHNIAQSAAMVAINDIRNDSNSDFHPSAGQTYVFPGADQLNPWGDMHGEYHLEVTNQADTLLHMQSTGKFEDTIYRVNVGLSKGSTSWNPIIDQAIHAENSVSLGGNDFVDGDVTINSIQASAVNLGSQPKVKIGGSLMVGPGGDPESVVAGNLTNVGGNTGAMLDLLKYTMPVFPDFPAVSSTGSSVYSSTSLSTSDYNGKYIPEIALSGNATLNIDTGEEGDEVVMHVGKFDVQSSNVNLSGSGKLTMYVDTHIDLKGKGTVNEGGDVNQLMVYYKGNQEVELYEETLDFGGNTYFNGSLFADKANIKLFGTAGIQGNVITGGDHVDLKGNAEAISRSIFAPNATVEANGTVYVRGSIISYQFVGSGTTTVEYDPDLDTEWPDLEQIGEDFVVLYWN